MDIQTLGEFISTEETARRIGVTRVTIRSWILAGVIRHDEWIRPGGERKRYRIAVTAIERLLNNH